MQKSICNWKGYTFNLLNKTVSRIESDSIRHLGKIIANNIWGLTSTEEEIRISYSETPFSFEYVGCRDSGKELLLWKTKEASL